MKTMSILGLLLCTILGCGGVEDETASLAATSYTAHWVEDRSANNFPHCGAIPDMPVSAPNCTAFATTMQGPGGECSVGCFAEPGGVGIALGCHACSSHYDVTFK